MQEYGCWSESSWISPELDQLKTGVLTAGIDIGTTSSQAVVMSGKNLLSYANLKTGWDFKNASKLVLNRALENTGLSFKDISRTASTGFGHHNADFADRYIDEVQCHAKGGRYLFGPEVTTVIDLGGQTVKAIRLHKWDRVMDFMIGDKCATGMGRNIEEICNLLHVKIDAIGDLSLAVEKDPEPVSTTCFAFAQTETIGLFKPDFKAEPLTPEEIYASYLFAIAWRILGVVGKLMPLDVGDIKVYKELGFTGGLAKNKGITRRIERELGITALEPKYDPMLAGAIGAALLGMEESEKR